MNKTWNLIIDITTIIWVVAFGLSFYLKGNLLIAINIILILIILIYLTELIILFIGKKSLKQFFKENWLDILLLIPFFRVFRILRFTKAKKLLRFLKLIKKNKHIKRFPEFIDLTSKSKERIIKRK